MNLVRQVVYRGVAMVGVTAAIAVAMAAPASANRAGACNHNQSLCNTMYGKNLHVDDVLGVRYDGLSDTGIGFFQIFGPHGYKRTGDTVKGEVEHRFEVNKDFAVGDLICLQFWAKNKDGSFTQKGGNVCGTMPIK
ncbi:hypothetical protein ACFVWG_35640 [Kribbella sp. NPDC058245]|uniref:hypothetical protein n=1 Tax=Kribbella sp. NPDC058245 TaxID=3346399 RepID=UPI0036E2A086